MIPLRETPLSPVGAQLGVVTPLTPPRRWCPYDGPRPNWLPPDKFHCGQDHYLQGTYGITCDDYWRLFYEQDSRCAICGKPPSTRRLVVDHDHQTGSIDGLAHFGCNRRLHHRLRQYLANPPGRELGLVVTPAKLRTIQADDVAKRRRERERRATPLPDRTSGDFRARTQAALAATKQGGT